MPVNSCCCGSVPPDCCVNEGQDYNKATARLQGHVSADFTVGVNVLHVEFDYDFNMDTCGGNAFTRQATADFTTGALVLGPNNSDSTDWMDTSTAIVTLNGANVLIPGSTFFVTMDILPIFGGNWTVDFDTDGVVGFPIHMYLDGVSATVLYAGTTTSIASTNLSGTSGGGYDYDTTLDMTITNNTGCP